jgi:hypothetical protein
MIMKRILPTLFLLAAMASQGQLVYLPQDSILFEHNTTPCYIVPATGNCWQAGHPQKTYLNAPWSPPLAIMTDTVNPYPPSTTSMFAFTIDSNSTYVNLLGASYFSFIHKYDIDPNGDYGFIEYSIDGGVNWCELNPQQPNCSFPYCWWEPDSSLTSHQLSPHPAQITGLSDGWIFSRCHMDYFVGKHEGGIPDSILIRFVFRSDAITTPYEGWMVDNIIMGACTFIAGVPELPGPGLRIEVVPNPVTGSSEILLPKEVAEGTPVVVLDASGRVVRRFTAGKELRISSKELAPGAYIVRTTLEDGRPLAGKIVVD